MPAVADMSIDPLVPQALRGLQSACCSAIADALFPVVSAILLWFG